MKIDVTIMEVSKELLFDIFPQGGGLQSPYVVEDKPYCFAHELEDGRFVTNSVFWNQQGLEYFASDTLVSDWIAANFKPQLSYETWEGEWGGMYGNVRIFTKQVLEVKSLVLIKVV